MGGQCLDGSHGRYLAGRLRPPPPDQIRHRPCLTGRHVEQACSGASPKAGHQVMVRCPGVQLDLMMAGDPGDLFETVGILPVLGGMKRRHERVVRSIVAAGVERLSAGREEARVEVPAGACHRVAARQGSWSGRCFSKHSGQNPWLIISQPLRPR